MRFFFRSRQFKIILSVFLCLVAISVIFTVIGGKISPQADVLGTVTAPFRAAATYISETFADISDALSGNNETELRNVELENEINENFDTIKTLLNSKREQNYQIKLIYK